ncbi:hypothetical protein [Microvirga tunisiensis]|uniref:Uncharacterized protein n=1 Tax=Microvirga tunisiensis TaxID=2108360 RepID=A0A5N7MYY7_9HYPH|nr:hypothetical protein [Microvirga tunisiensis]MPR11119.1 hypothetical protein [Microvirga tunisiensis]MPR29206.1 hypothetical protein [Microvirga tunisiensis]
MPIREELPKYAVYVPTRNIMPDRDAALADSIDLSRLRDYGEHLIDSDPHCLNLGSPARRREILGRYHVRPEPFAEANTTANAILSRFEKSIGIALSQ